MEEEEEEEQAERERQAAAEKKLDDVFQLELGAGRGEGKGAGHQIEKVSEALKEGGGPRNEEIILEARFLVRIEAWSLVCLAAGALTQRSSPGRQR